MCCVSESMELESMIKSNIGDRNSNSSFSYLVYFNVIFKKFLRRYLNFFYVEGGLNVYFLVVF